MKCYLLLFLLPLCALAADLGKVLDSIAAVENTPIHIVGRAGERSRYQMLYTTWRTYTSESFAKASRDERLGRLVAMTHLRYLEITLKHQGLQATPRNLAQAWHGGINSLRHTPSAYAIRVENVYGSKP